MSSRASLPKQFIMCALALAAILVATAQGSRAQSALETLRIDTDSGRHVYQVEIAQDEPTRERGLMNRRFMPRDRGMLFEFERVAPVSFWMKDTYISLDMIFIAPDGTVTRVSANAEPLSEAIIPSGPPCVAVLELNAGVAAEIGVKAGDKIRHPFFKP